MCQYSRSMLRKGFTSVAMRDGDFLYSYMLWFEDQVVRYSFTCRGRGSAYVMLLCMLSIATVHAI